VSRTPPCPICGRPALPRAQNRAYPFCSDRCRLIDLGKWLGEEYRVPGPNLGDGVEQPGRPVEQEDDEP
jgi:uncharacterized protein